MYNTYSCCIFSGSMEKKLVMESCLRSHRWGLQEMHLLLTEDIVEFDVNCSCFERNTSFGLSTINNRQPLNIKCHGNQLKCHGNQQQDLLLSLLIARCPVSYL